MVKKALRFGGLVALISNGSFVWIKGGLRHLIQYRVTIQAIRRRTIWMVTDSFKTFMQEQPDRCV